MQLFQLSGFSIRPLKLRPSQPHGGQFNFPVLILLCSLFMMAQPTLADTNNGQPTSKVENEAYLKQLREDITKLQAWLDKAQDDHKKLVDELRSSDKDVSSVSKQVDDLRRLLRKERERLKKLQGEQKQLRQQQSQQKTTLKTVIRASYYLGQQPQLQVMLNQEEPSRVTRQLTYLRYLSKAHKDQIDQYRNTLSKLTLVENEINQQRQSLETQLEKFRSEQKTLRKKRAHQQKLAKSLQGKIDSSDQSLDRLKQDRQRLISLLGKVEEVFLPYERKKESRPFTKLRGRLPWPIQRSPQRLYGKTQPNRKQRWQGWLYPASQGSDIRAIHHGRVVFSDWLRGYGLLTIIDHGQGYMTLYARNQSLLTSPGEWVEAGDIIAQVGRSGGFNKDALYFEIRKKGKPQNPSRWLSKS